MGLTNEEEAARKAKVDREEEAAKQRKRLVDHTLRGFANFDNFKELEAWKETDVDPLQKANVPLLKRPHILGSLEQQKSSNVLLMHDYKGNYVPNGYEGCQGATIFEQDYILEQWQRVDVFNYFTHFRVSIPPPTWVNAGHRNGTLVLGTFLIEAKKGEIHPEQHLILKKTDDGRKYFLADVLTRMAACYGFDGWLINIEVETADPAWDEGKSLETLLDQLRNGLRSLPSGGKVIWYDALTKNGEVVYQNTLDRENLGFAKAAGSIITNYWWEPAMADEAVTFAKNNEMGLDCVYFGVDCWGQTHDSDKKEENGRLTIGFDEHGIGTARAGTGHGGTATGLVVKALAQRQLGCGIFACGWACEHFPRGRVVDRFMWEGEPDYLEKLITLDDQNSRKVGCKCWDIGFKNPIGIQQHMRSDFKDNGIARTARHYPAGSEAFFHTDYTEAMAFLGPDKDNPGKELFRAHLGQQSILPAPKERSAPLHMLPKGASDAAAGAIKAEMKHTPSRCSVYVVLSSSITGAGAQIGGHLQLHQLNARGDFDLDLIIAYQTQPLASSGFIIKLLAKVGSETKSLDLPSSPPSQRATQVLQIRNTHNNVTAVAIGVQGPVQNLVAGANAIGLLDIFSLCLKPSGQAYPQTPIHNARILQKGSVDLTRHYRLVWSIGDPKSDNAPIAPISVIADTGAKSSRPPPLPWSSLTGPFEYFDIWAGGKELGRAYAKEFILEKEAVEGWKRMDGKVDIEIRGVAFDGSTVGEFKGMVSLV